MKSAAQALILLALATPAFAADVVVPVDSVENSVNIRMEADPKSEIVGKLSQGDSLPFRRNVPDWNEVKLEDDAYGYISEDWSNVISDQEFAARQAVIEKEPVEEVSLVEVTVDAEPMEVSEESTNVAAEASEIVEDVAEVVSESSPAMATEKNAESTADVAEVTGDVADTQEVSADAAVAEDEIIAEEVVAEEVAAAGKVAAEPASEEADVSAAKPEVVATTVVVPVPGAGSEPTSVQQLQGPTGPQGPPGEGSVKGTEDFLVKFTDDTVGGNSQIFDNGRNVGIGTTNPTQRLEVNGNIQIHEQNSNVAGLMLTQSSGEMGYIMHNRANTLTLGAGSIDRLTIDGDGNVGIGMARPSHPIEMVSGAYVSAGGVWTNSSSREKKENIVTLTPEEALAALAGLEPVRFNYKQDESEEYVGFIAEDVPGLVASEDRSSLSTMDIVAVLTRVVQQQQQKITELEMRLDRDTR